jgi:hypothetical protein
MKQNETVILEDDVHETRWLVVSKSSARRSFRYQEESSNTQELLAYRYCERRLRRASLSSLVDTTFGGLVGGIVSYLRPALVRCGWKSFCSLHGGQPCLGQKNLRPTTKRKEDLLHLTFLSRPTIERQLRATANQEG